ncbi:ATP-dependent RNA helicase DHX58-like isoform X9 [Ostrea edulis]|nr:ATP-dependent RNA helicase DHX58-like isoform X9 [Ostrea edulis]
MEDLLHTIEDSSHGEKWTKFVNIVERKGYEYVAKALRGEEVNSDVFKKYTRLLEPHKMNLVERLNPEDLLVTLETQKRVITTTDREQIKAEMKNKGPMAGTIVLLDRIWRRFENWYRAFLDVLCQKEYKYLVEEIDDEFAEEWDKKIQEGNHPEDINQQCSVDAQGQFQNFITPVQCVSDNDEYNLGSSLNINSLVSSGCSRTIKPISVSDDNLDEQVKNAEEITGEDVEETTEKEVEITKTKENHANETESNNVYPCKSVEDTTQESTSIEDKEVILDTFEERRYQNELAEPAKRGQNCLIIAPTGSGKTIVAVKIIQHHLQVKTRPKIKKIAFVVDKNNLAKQQHDAIQRFVDCRLKVISGDTMREEEFTDLSALLTQYDVFVITAQMLVNAMHKRDVSIESFTLLIFDECHHCHGGHSFYKTMIPYHDKKHGHLEDQIDLPQIVGCTASIGVGKAKNVDQTVEHVKVMMANLDADVLVSVQRNRQELAEKMNTPEQSIVKIQTRKTDEFGTRIKILMTKTEECLKEAADEMDDKYAANPPTTKGNEQYTQWLQDVLLKAVAKVHDPTLSRSLYTARNYLKIYNEGLILYSYARATDCLNAIIENFEELPKPAKTATKVEQHLKSLFENEIENLKVCTTDKRKSEENPLLLKLKEIIVDTYHNESDMRGIVFVRTRPLADILASWMNETDDLKHIKAKKCTGAQAQRTDGGMTKVKQKETIDLFRKGDFKLIFATTIAEEGLDIKECNLVVRYDYAGNPISQIQAKGRGRAENSRFYILASEDKSVAEREWTNSLKEPMMEDAMLIVQQEIATNNERFQLQKQELQRLAKRQREAAAQNKGVREVPDGQYVLRCLKCKEYMCLSGELRKLGSNYACIGQDFKDHVFCKKSEQVKYDGKNLKVGIGKVGCKECREKIGVVALYKEILFPVLQIKSLKIEDDMKRGDNVKKWKTVEERYFKVPPISLVDMEKISEAERLIDMD